MSSYSSKSSEDKIRLLNYFLTQGHDKDFMRDLLVQCNWSKSQTTRALEEMKKGSDAPEKKDKATGQKTGSLSPGLSNSQEFSISPLLRKKVKSQPQLLEQKKYRQLIERCRHFMLTFYLAEVEFTSDELREFAPKTFFESSHLKYLSNRLNWWVKYGNYTPLAPLRTQGDGNCLLHAVSRAIFGVEDEELVLRGLLHEYLRDPVGSRRLKARWKRQQAEMNGRAGFEFDAGEWENEWDMIVSLASIDITITEPNLQSYEPDASAPSLPYKSLEEIHIFALAHVIHRPIIVIADSILQDVEGRPISPVYFGGVYLPLDREPRKCCKIPIVLTYCCSHFAPLVACYNDLLAPGISTNRFQKVLVPLVGPEGDRLKIQFQGDQERTQHSSLEYLARYPSYVAQDMIRLSEYLDLEEFFDSDCKTVVAAKICPSTHEFYSDIIANLVTHTEVKLEEYKLKKAKELREKELKDIEKSLTRSQISYPPLSTNLTYPYSRSTRTSKSSILPVPLTSKLSPHHLRGDSYISNRTELSYPRSSAREYGSATDPYPGFKVSEITTTISPREISSYTHTGYPRSPQHSSSYTRDTSYQDKPYLSSYKTQEQSTNTDISNSFFDSYTPRYLPRSSNPTFSYSSKSDSLPHSPHRSHLTEPYPYTSKAAGKKDPVELMDLAKEMWNK